MHENTNGEAKASPGPFVPGEPVSVTLRRAICILKAKVWIQGESFAGVTDPEIYSGTGRALEYDYTPESVPGVCAIGAVNLAQMDPKQPIRLQVSNMRSNPASIAMADIPNYNDREGMHKESVIKALERSAEIFEQREADGHGTKKCPPFDFFD